MAWHTIARRCRCSYGSWACLSAHARPLWLGWLIAVGMALGTGPWGAWADPPSATAPATPSPAASAPAAIAPVASSRPTHYMGRPIAATMHYDGAPWLVRESRQREEDCQRLLAELRLRPGQVVCDLGCGNGFYTLELARRVGSTGTVYAVDIQPEMLKMLHKRMAAARLANIVPILGAEADPKLPRARFDLVLLVDVYHEFSHPEAMLAAIRRALRPGGQVALAEFRAEDPNVPIRPEHKMSKAQILREFNANGFRLVRQFDGLPWQHLMFFESAE